MHKIFVKINHLFNGAEAFFGVVYATQRKRVVAEQNSRVPFSMTDLPLPSFLVLTAAALVDRTGIILLPLAIVEPVFD